MRFNFHFGRKKTTVYDHAMIGLILDIAQYLCLRFLNISEEKFIRLVDDANREHFHNQKLNDYVLANDKWLENRITSEIDRALTDIDTDVIIEEPKFSEEIEGDTLLGGEIRLTAPYYRDDNEH